MELSVVYMKMGGAQLPVTDSTLVVVPYTAWKFVVHACQVLGPSNVRQGFVGQSDFMIKACWQGYTGRARRARRVRRAGREIWSRIQHQRQRGQQEPVSYTHLTLPTKA